MYCSTARDIALGSHGELSAHITYSSVAQISVPATPRYLSEKKFELQTGFSALDSSERQRKGNTNSWLYELTLSIDRTGLCPSWSQQALANQQVPKTIQAGFVMAHYTGWDLLPFSDTYPKCLLVLRCMFWGARSHCLRERQSRPLICCHHRNDVADKKKKSYNLDKGEVLLLKRLLSLRLWHSVIQTSNVNNAFPTATLP